MDMTIPGVETLAPRDGRRMGKSADWLFYLLPCRNLAVNRHQFSMVHEYVSPDGLSGDRYCYLPEHIDGHLCHSITLERVERKKRPLPLAGIRGHMPILERDTLWPVL